MEEVQRHPCVRHCVLLQGVARIKKIIVVLDEHFYNEE